MVENSDNAHFFNDNYFFKNIISMEPSTGVATIGGTYHIPNGIGNASVTWR